jgi:hypothetical protein
MLRRTLSEQIRLRTISRPGSACGIRSRCGMSRTTGGARHRRQLRDRAVLVESFRSDVRRRDPQTPHRTKTPLRSLARARGRSFSGARCRVGRRVGRHSLQGRLFQLDLCEGAERDFRSRGIRGAVKHRLAPRRRLRFRQHRQWAGAGFHPRPPGDPRRAYIDVGMGLVLGDGALTGMLRATTSTPVKRDHVRGKGRISFAKAGEDNEYERNI